ncbi:NIPSNAP family protein [Actinomadura sp. KC345]|nr:NIPSNAP family protein [Actinomadura sp. KC345]
MIYELREYTAAPGGAEALHARFADHTLALFERLGMEVAGFWSDLDDPGRILYLLRFPDEEARRAAWAAFQADPEWRRVKAESEAGGAIVETMTSRRLGTAPYWPHETTRSAAGRGERESAT